MRLTLLIINAVSNALLFGFAAYCIQRIAQGESVIVNAALIGISATFAADNFRDVFQVGVTQTSGLTLGGGMHSD